MPAHPDHRIDQFIAYISARGIPETYHDLYRSELVAILLTTGSKSVDDLDAISLGDAVREAEKRLRARRAVCVALDEFLRYLRQPPRSQVAPQPLPEEAAPDSFDASRSKAVHMPDEGRHRKYVRVPFNGEIEVDGSLSNNRASDISLGGMYLETVQAWEAGTLLRLRFRLHTDEPLLKAKARVVYFDPGIGAGLDFVDPSREVRQAIKRFVEQAVAGQGQGDW